MNVHEFFEKNDEMPELRVIFAELARRIGKQLTDIQLNDRNSWPYDQYEWTEEEEKDFHKWLLDYLYKHSVKIFGYKMTKKRLRRHVTPYFLLQYSWKYKGD